MAFVVQPQQRLEDNYKVLSKFVTQGQNRADRAHAKLVFDKLVALNDKCVWYELLIKAVLKGTKTYNIKTETCKMHTVNLCLKSGNTYTDFTVYMLLFSFVFC